ncbi:MAG: HD domain-containing protein [Planctomycetes bacterium]|nr:HD domain-containing protein [Planctomycetota bacterium]
MTTFKLPEQKALPTESVDSWCRELTDITGLAFAAWDTDLRFWMAVGFSSTLTGLIVGCEPLRKRMQEPVERALENGRPQQVDLGAGLRCIAVPVFRRSRPAFVVAAAVLGCDASAEEAAAWLAREGGCPETEAKHRLRGERPVADDALAAIVRLLTEFGSERIKRLDAEEEVIHVGGKLSESYEEITLYQRIASKIRVSQPSEAFFLALCSEMLEFLEIEGLAALFRDTQEQTGEPRVATVGDVKLDGDELLRLYHHFERDLMDGREAIIANECRESREFSDVAPDINNMVLVPMRQGNKLYGILAAFNKLNDGEFFSTDVKLMSSVTGTIAVFVENSHLYDNLHQLMLGTVRALVSSIDAKDQYTCGHSERVAWISRRIAERMGLDGEDVERVYLAGLLHDIGKIGIPEAILLKNGRLEPEEYDVMKKHPLIGAKILAGVRELEGVISGVLHHHERLDGQGYPKGLNNESVPLEGRIIGLADSLDAMTSHRVYRPAMPREKVQNEIIRCTGTQFDVRCVDALMDIGLTEILDSVPTQSGELSIGAGLQWRNAQ